MEVDSTPPQWLDKDFIQSLLRDNEKRGVLIVRDIDVRSAVGKGENYGSQLHRVAVNLTKGGKPEHRSLIVKSLPSSEFLIKFITDGGIFEKENKMYLETLPAMNQLLEDSPTRIRPIAPLSCNSYRTTRPHTLVLEDLTPSGYKMAPRHTGLDLPHATLAIRAMARLHALSVGLKERDPRCFDAYPEHMYTPEKRETTRQMMEPMIQNLATAVEKWDGFERFGGKIRSINFTDRIIKLFKIDKGIAVLNHGDGWVNNMMFKYSDTGEVEDVKFVDYQMCRYASPALDLQYFTLASYNEEVRYKHSDALLAEYHEEFARTLAEVGSDPNVMSLDELKREMEDKVLYGVLVACSLLPITLADPDDALDMDQFTADMVQTEQTENEWVKLYGGKRFRGVFEKLLLHFEKIGIF